MMHALLLYRRHNPIVYDIHLVNRLSKKKNNAITHTQQQQQQIQIDILFFVLNILFTIVGTYVLRYDGEIE